MTNVVFYDSSRLASVLSALAALEKYPDARLHDTEGLSSAEITAIVDALDDNTALVTYQKRIIATVGVAYAAGTGAADDIIFTTNPSTGEVFNVKYGSLVLATFTVGATETLAALVDGLEAGLVAGTGWNVESDGVDTITVTADPDLGDSMDGASVFISSDTATTTNDGPATLASGADPTGQSGDLLAADKTKLDTALATNPVGYDGDTAATTLAATATKALPLIAWEDLWPTHPAPEIIKFQSGYQIEPLTRSSFTATITAVGGANTKTLIVTGGSAGTIASIDYSAGAPASVTALALAMQQDIIDTKGAVGWTCERDGAVLTIYPPVGEDLTYLTYTLAAANFTVTESGDAFAGGTANPKVAQATNYSEVYLNDATDDILVTWKKLTNFNDGIELLPSGYPSIQSVPAWEEVQEYGQIIQDYKDL